MNIDLADGWVPKRLIYDGDEPLVELVLRGHAPLTKPFLYQDLFGYREARRIPLRAFGDAEDDGAAFRPSGFVFQMSRSGSTAAAHMLAAVERHAVLVEPSPLKDLFSPPTAISEETCVERLRALIGIYARGLLRPGQKLLIKLDERDGALPTGGAASLPRRSVRLHPP